MPYKNPQELVVGLAQLPIAIEAKLPEGAPKISQMMIDASTKGPALPDFLIELPDLPPVPELPGPTPPEAAAARMRYVTGVTMRPAAAPVAPAAVVAPRSQRYLF